MTFATLIDGYGDLAEWLLLFAFLAFAAAAVVILTDRATVREVPNGATVGSAWTPRSLLVAIGLALMALAWLVL